MVGRGLMGTCCARHLAESGHGVVLVGPDEPRNSADFAGPFGSFHDAGRITRAIATDPVWAEVSRRSVARYRDLETRSGLAFFTRCGAVMAGPPMGPGADFMASTLRTARDLNLDHAPLSNAALARRLPMFRFAGGADGVWDPTGGIVNPRAMRLAEERLAVAAGAEVVVDTVVQRDGSDVSLARHGRMSAGHIIVATGAYAAMGTLSAQPELKVYARTVLLAEVSEQDATALADMPSLIFWPEGMDYDLYLLPPIRYPDGRLYIKIGGEGDSPRLHTEAEARSWFQSPGSAAAGRTLASVLRAVMPALKIAALQTQSCAVSFTPTGHPVIDRISERVTLLAGGNGAGAKCADELGRLGAITAMGGDPGNEIAGADFTARFSAA